MPLSAALKMEEIWLVDLQFFGNFRLRRWKPDKSGTKITKVLPAAL